MTGKCHLGLTKGNIVLNLGVVGWWDGWVNFQCRGILLILIIVGQRPTALAVDAGGDCLDIFTLICCFSFSFSLSLGDGLI